MDPIDMKRARLWQRLANYYQNMPHETDRGVNGVNVSKIMRRVNDYVVRHLNGKSSLTYNTVEGWATKGMVGESYVERVEKFLDHLDAMAKEAAQ